ncbi:hypothetical protein ACUXZZ_27015 [Streptomyces graminifolii]|uniref:hypothetical protein n=1 Tax=Streptomyces graminifolii TaxID=1266771 RepID=UPI00405820B1
MLWTLKLLREGVFSELMEFSVLEESFCGRSRFARARWTWRGTALPVAAVVLVGGVLVVVLFSCLVGKVAIMTLEHGLNGHFVPGVVLTRGGERATAAPAHLHIRAWELFLVLSGSLRVRGDSLAVPPGLECFDNRYVDSPVRRATLEASA